MLRPIFSGFASHRDASLSGVAPILPRLRACRESPGLLIGLAARPTRLIGEPQLGRQIADALRLVAVGA
jgi:hypothetical protein